jgi:photosystem II stability/assembly factor-like uncharacterized protein
MQPPAPSAPAALENFGKPMTLPYECTSEDQQWAGLACSEDEPCPIYLELSAAESSGARLFVAGNIHSSTVTLYSVLLASDDSGLTWRESHPRIRGAGLDHIQFFDTATGWAGGEVLYPLPRDPFLLVTTDGGRSWRQRSLFTETFNGSLQHFLFTSRTSGSAILDRGSGSPRERYALYETPDGGETWVIRQESNRPLDPGHSSADAPAWRVRADGPTQSFHVERLEGAGWSSVAAFAVQLKTCQAP